MSETVIKVEGLGKKYIIGHQGKAGYKTFREQIGTGIKGVLSKTKQMLSGQQVVEGDEAEEFWALKDIGFEVRQGETLGIIGRNGAGKSTLLKILSRITEPTTGKVILKGRVASLLEVGTGFHPELTGRENIFLNGAILGMNRLEIKRKFDEIVDFSGVEKFLDTPVKRYSSGMYVRLAFSVAAHLEPEILVVDEVLAVGDAEFQKKCLGRMKDVTTNDGRTVLFVSHNMGAIKTLCNNVIVMRGGEVCYKGDVNKSINLYLEDNVRVGDTRYEAGTKTGSHFKLIEITDDKNISKQEFNFDEKIILKTQINIDDRHLSSRVGIRVTDNLERCVFTTEANIRDFVEKGQEITLAIEIPSGLLVPNRYRLQFGLHIPNVELIELLPDIIQFTIHETGSNFFQYKDVDYGCVIVNCKWQILEG